MKKKLICSLGVIAFLSASSAYSAEPTKLPQGEVNKGGKMFEENDTNKDGAISKDEWRARGDKMFSQTDGNSDGKLTQEETKAHYDKKRAEWKERRAERKEKMGEMKENLVDNKAAPATPAAVPVVKQ